MKVEGLHHASIPVTDAERFREFYRLILPLEEIERQAYDFPGVSLGLGSGQPNLTQHSDAKMLRRRNEIDSWGGHIALRVWSY